VISTPIALLSAAATHFELSHALRVSDVTRLFVQPRLLPLALAVARKVGILDDHIYILDGRVRGRLSFGDMIDRARANHIPRISVRPAKIDTLAYLIFSSGTSGLPKGRLLHLKG
jgi:long-subunit acyl-CoA synthetase (AMP-forming)